MKNLGDSAFWWQEYVEKGRSVSEIGRSLGLSSSAALRRFEALGFSFCSRAGRRLGGDGVLSRQSLWDLYVEQDISAKEIARRAGVSAATVRTALRTAEIPARAPGRPPGCRTRPEAGQQIAAEIRRQEISRRLALGEKMVDIARHLGITKQAVWRQVWILRRREEKADGR